MNEWRGTGWASDVNPLIEDRGFWKVRATHGAWWFPCRFPEIFSVTEWAVLGDEALRSTPYPRQLPRYIVSSRWGLPWRNLPLEQWGRMTGMWWHIPDTLEAELTGMEV